MFFWLQVAETNLSKWDCLLEEYQGNLGEKKRLTAKNGAVSGISPSGCSQKLTRYQRVPVFLYLCSKYQEAEKQMSSPAGCGAFTADPVSCDHSHVNMASLGPTFDLREIISSLFTWFVNNDILQRWWPWHSAVGIFISWGKAMKFEVNWDVMKTQCHQPLRNLF